MARAQVMAPFTPFFCEALYQNLRRALPPDAPRSVHWCDFPEAAAAQVRTPPRPRNHQHIKYSCRQVCCTRRAPLGALGRLLGSGCGTGAASPAPAGHVKP